MKIVCAGTYREYAQWCNKNESDWRHGTRESMFVSHRWSVMSRNDYLPDDIVVVGTFWQRPDAPEVYHEVYARAQRGLSERRRQDRQTA